MMNRGEAQNRIFFRIHMLLVAVGLFWYATAIGWLAWQIVVGGAFALALGVVVIGVLLCIMLTACGTAAVIALEGRSKHRQVKPPSAQPRLVSADRWTIREPVERRQSF